MPSPPPLSGFFLTFYLRASFFFPRNRARDEVIPPFFSVFDECLNASMLPYADVLCGYWVLCRISGSKSAPSFECLVSLTFLFFLNFYWTSAGLVVCTSPRAVARTMPRLLLRKGRAEGVDKSLANLFPPFLVVVVVSLGFFLDTPYVSSLFVRTRLCFPTLGHSGEPDPLPLGSLPPLLPPTENFSHRFLRKTVYPMVRRLAPRQSALIISALPLLP